MAIVSPLSVLFFILLIARLTFTVLFLVPSINCLKNRVIIEQCGNLTFSQDLKNILDLCGNVIESESTVSYMLTIFLWSRFSTCNFFRGLYRVPIFWFWLTMIVFTLISVISIDFSKSKIVVAIGVSLLLEITSQSLLCCALKFVKKITVKRSLERWLPSHRFLPVFLYYLYISTMWAYLLRNLSLFVYDTSVLVGKIKRRGKLEHIDKLLLFMNIATRGSFVQFFYSLIFRNPKIPVVCENVENSKSYDLYGPIGVRDSSGRTQPLVGWDSTLEKAMREAQIRQ